jgi:leucyl-tRNA synthetase
LRSIVSEAALEHVIPAEYKSEYSPRSLEAHWQEAWRAEKAFATPAPGDQRTPAYVFADCPIACANEDIKWTRTYTLADTYARFLRARRRAVLFSLGFDSFGPAVELEAIHRGSPPREVVTSWCEQTRSRFQALGYSCDLNRTFVSSEPEYYTWTQRLFLTMLERDLVYQRAGQWLMRIDPHVNLDVDDRGLDGLDALTSWDTAAIELQRALVGRIEGVEMQASTFGRGDLTVFTTHAQAIASATFIAISPAHPKIDDWTTEPAVAERVLGMREASGQTEHASESAPIAVTDVLAAVPGVAGMLPIVISPLVDARFGPTAVLGIPDLDATDRAIAQQLPEPAGAMWKMSSSRPKMHPAVRYLAHDVAISRARAWGAPLPLVYCTACGTVPVPLAELPVRLPDDLRILADGENPLERHEGFRQCACPTCGAPALHETATLDPRMDRMWMWMAMCVPPERRASTMIDDPEHARWLPVQQLFSHADAAAGLLERRLLAAMLQDLGELEPLPDREPFAKVMLHQSVHVDDPAMSTHLGNLLDLDDLIERVGSDTVRLAMLYAASPGRTFAWDDQPLRHCQRFLASLYSYAQPRLSEWREGRDQAGPPARIDTADKLRRRLAHWCAVACEKITAALERLELQRAAHDEILLLTRIQDFESRAMELRADLEALDREAIVAALLLLVQLLAPLTPHIAEELWSAAGNESPLSDAGWPTPSRSAQPDRSEASGLPQ